MPQPEQDQFLADLEPKQEDPFGEKSFEPSEITSVEEPKETPVEEEPNLIKNRHIRRMEAKLQSERENSIKLAARLEALSETQKFNGDADEAISRIYGTDTPEGREATRLLQKAMDDRDERILSKLREERSQEQEAARKEETRLDSFIEEIEDDNNVTISKQDQKNFFQLLEKLSPKDRQGNITEYADHHAVWEEYQSRKKPDNAQAKAVASRSMTQSSGSPKETVAQSANERWLMENGLI